jgi:hypothetical protein
MSATGPILETYRQATSEELVAGREWYADARRFAVVLAHTSDHRPAVTCAQAAGVIAALSPITSWSRNKELALRAIVDHNATGTLGNSCRNANRILNGEPVITVLKSLKTWNFYLSIMGEWMDAVCIDRHAWEVYKGMRYSVADRPRITPKMYHAAAAAYRHAAQRLAIDATTLQATTWLVWRRIHLTGTRYERFL